MKSILKYCYLFLLILLLTELNAQEAITATGGNVSEKSGSVSYSVGQVFYQTQTGSKGALTEGMQHPYSISVVHEITGTNEIKLSVLAYPNPATHILNLEVDNYDSGKMEYLISDIQGKLLLHNKLTGTKTSIEMVHLPPSIYILKLVNDNQLLKTFKIVKN